MITPATQPSANGDGSRGDAFVNEIFDEPLKSSFQGDYRPPTPLEETLGPILGHASVPPRVVHRRPGEVLKDPWHILGEALRDGSEGIDESVLRINLGVVIVMFGHRYVLNREFGIKVGTDPDKQKDGGNLTEWLRNILGAAPALEPKKTISR